MHRAAKATLAALLLLALCGGALSFTDPEQGWHRDADRMRPQQRPKRPWGRWAATQKHPGNAQNDLTHPSNAQTTPPPAAPPLAGRLLVEFRDVLSKRSSNWKNAFETWTCPTNASNSDAPCDPCGRYYIGNWDHFYCRGPSNGTGESGVGEYDGFVSNIHICDTHIDGPVPRELCAFHRLRELDLDGGQLTGPIPEWLVGGLGLRALQ